MDRHSRQTGLAAEVCPRMAHRSELCKECDRYLIYPAGSGYCGCWFGTYLLLIRYSPFILLVTAFRWLPNVRSATVAERRQGIGRSARADAGRPPVMGQLTPHSAASVIRRPVAAGQG